MDFRSACGRSRMRGWFRDRPDIEVEGEWHWCPPGADPVPFEHPWTNYFFDSNSPGYTGIGEVVGSYRYSKGRSNPRYDGRHVCGTAEQWLHGGLYADRGKTPVDEEGVPLCCHALPLQAGGGMGGGTARIVYGRTASTGLDLGWAWGGPHVGAEGVRLSWAAELASAGATGLDLGWAWGGPGIGAQGVRLSWVWGGPEVGALGVRLGWAGTATGGEALGLDLGWAWGGPGIGAQGVRLSWELATPAPGPGITLSWELATPAPGPGITLSWA